MKKLHLKLILLTAVLAVLAFSQTVTAATLDLTDDEYDLYIDEYPDEISECVYAKFSKSKSDVDDYYVNLSYDDGSDNFENSLNKSGIRLSDNELMCSFTPSLWYVDPEGEADDRKKTDSIVLYCPLPDEAQQHPADCTAYSVASGKAKKLGTPFETNSDDVVYVKLELPPYSTIGFVYRSEDSYEDEDDSDEDSDEPDEPDEPDNDDGDDGFDDPDDDDPDDDGEEDDDDPDDDGDEEPDPDDEDTDESFRDNDEDFYYDDDEYFYDDGHGTVNPSDSTEPVVYDDIKEPSKTGTDTNNIKKTENNESSGTKSSGSASKPSDARTVKDSIPRTGDDFPYFPIAAAGIGALAAAVTALILIKRNK